MTMHAIKQSVDRTASNADRHGMMHSRRRYELGSLKAVDDHASLMQALQIARHRERVTTERSDLQVGTARLQM